MGSHVHAGPGSQRRLELGEEIAPCVQIIDVEALRLPTRWFSCVMDRGDAVIIIILLDISRGFWDVSRTAWQARHLFLGNEC